MSLRFLQAMALMGFRGMLIALIFFIVSLILEQYIEIEMGTRPGGKHFMKRDLIFLFANGKKINVIHHHFGPHHQY